MALEPSTAATNEELHAPSPASPSPNDGDVVVEEEQEMEGLNPQFLSLFREFELDLVMYRDRINKLAAKYGNNDDDDDDDDDDGLLQELEEKELAGYAKWQKDWLQKLNAAANVSSSSSSSLDKEQRQRIRDFVLTAHSKAIKIIEEAAIYWRAITRPRGYVGDAESMNLLYRNQYEGSTPFGKLAHKNATCFQISQAVRNRKQYLTQHIRHCCSRSRTRTNEGAGAKVLSVAAGPAVEILDYLEENPESNGTFLALDHDIDTIRNVNGAKNDDRITYAIANAYHMIKGSDTIAFPRGFFLPSLDPSKDFKGIMAAVLAPLKYRIEKLAENQFDLVYSAGLYDYIETFDTVNKGTKALTRFLFTRVRPGGKLVIGNVNREHLPDDEYFMVEYLLNWVLWYRNDDEIMSFIEGIPKDEIASAQVEREATGINSFLVVVKKAI